MSLRVLHVTHRYLPAIGGSEKYIADISEELVRRGHQVDVFTSQALSFLSWKNELSPFEEINGVNVYRFKSMRRREYVWRILHYSLYHYWRNRALRYEPLIFFGGGPLSPGMFWRILKSGRQYDIIHLNCLVYSHVAYGYWAAKKLGIPVIVTPHVHTDQEVTYNIGYQRRILSGADHILVDTPGEEKFMLGLGLPQERISLGGLGLHQDEFPAGDTLSAKQKLGIPGDKFVILYLGRKDKYKGIQPTLEAFIQLQKQYSQLHFLAVGPESEHSLELWKEHQNLANLSVLGTVSHADKITALQACDCLVMPSEGEAFGIVYIEAWMMGKPVIGAKSQAVDTVIEANHDGLLAQPNDIADLARCISYFIKNPSRKQEMGQNGRRKVLAHYTVEQVGNRVETAYQHLLNRGNLNNG